MSSAIKVLKYLKAMLIEVLTFLKGKKSTMVAIVALILSYLALKGMIGQDEQVLFNGILAVLGLGANIATNKLVK
jgi:hypothetical protein